MFVGITQRIITNDLGQRLDALEHEYSRYYSSFGADIIPLPNDPKKALQLVKNLKIKHLILSGGGTINPALYGGQVDKAETYMPERDATEQALLRYAVQHGICVLGECRGAQMVNVFFGGTLLPVAEAVPHALNHVRTTHPIKVSTNPLVKIPQKDIVVNSYHNQGFSKAKLGRSLKIFAEAPDGIIEGVFHTTLPIYAIMWHPEREVQPTLFNKAITKKFLS